MNAWKDEFAAKHMPPISSHHKVGGGGRKMPISKHGLKPNVLSNNNKKGPIIKLSTKTGYCLLFVQESRLGPRKKQMALVDFWSSGCAARTFDIIVCLKGVGWRSTK